MIHKILCRTSKGDKWHTSYAIDCTCGDWTGFWSQPEYAFWNWTGHAALADLDFKRVKQGEAE